MIRLFFNKWIFFLIIAENRYSIYGSKHVAGQYRDKLNKLFWHVDEIRYITNEEYQKRTGNELIGSYVINEEEKLFQKVSRLTIGLTKGQARKMLSELELSTN